MILKKFDLGVYPIDLWVCVGTDLTELIGKFNYLKLDIPFCDIGWDPICDGFVNSVIELETRMAGILVVFKNLESNGLIAHEAMHVTQRVWKRIGEKRVGREAEAYLLGHIINCIESVKKEYDGKEN